VPSSRLSGVADGAFVAGAGGGGRAVDPSEVPIVLTLDGQPYVAGTLIAADGVHLVEAVATDAWGQAGHASLTFTLDQTPPQIGLVRGVGRAGGRRARDGPPWPSSSRTLGSQVVTLDGVPFASGTTVAAEGVHEVSRSSRTWRATRVRRPSVSRST